MELLKKESPNQGKAHLDLVINGKRYEWSEQFITGVELRKLGGIPEDDEIFLSIKKPWADELILNDTKVNLARPEIEEFFSKDKDFSISLIINLKEKKWFEKKISFEQVVGLAYGSYEPKPEIAITVTYDRGPQKNPEGALVAGENVFVKDKMIFNVKKTDRS